MCVPGFSGKYRERKFDLETYSIFISKPGFCRKRLPKQTTKYPNRLKIQATHTVYPKLHWVQKISAHSWFLGVKWLFWNRNLKTIPSEYRDILYLILKVLIRSLKWGTVRLWTPTGCKDTSRQSWTFEKNLSFTTKTSAFFERSTLTADGGRSRRSSETCCISFWRSI